MIEMNYEIILLQFAQAGKEMTWVLFSQRSGMALVRTEDFIESHDDETSGRQTKSLIEMAQDDRPGELSRVHQRIDWLMHDRNIDFVVA